MDYSQTTNKYDCILEVIFYLDNHNINIKNNLKKRKTHVSPVYHKRKWMHIKVCSAPNIKHSENWFQCVLQLATGSKAFGRSA